MCSVLEALLVTVAGFEAGEGQYRSAIQASRAVETGFWTSAWEWQLSEIDPL